MHAMLKNLSYLLKYMIFVIDTTKLNGHELDKDTLRLTHDHFKVKSKITKVNSPSSSFFNLKLWCTSSIHIVTGIIHLVRLQNFLEN